jgi:PTH2 family peptidyl-tRNA hydrolase
VPDEPKLRIYLNTNAKMTRGKAAAHAVHAALTAAGVHPGIPVVVLGAKPREIEAMRTSIRDEGRTELEPGTLTAGTDWRPTTPAPPEDFSI